MPKITPGVQSGKDRSGTPSARSISRLEQLEKAIRDGQGDYVAVGSALTEIQSSRVYKPQYSTFEEYSEKRWDFARQTAYDYIHAAEVNVRLSVQNKPLFKQAVELSRLPESQRQEIADTLDFASATVKDVVNAVNAALGRKPDPKPTEPKEISLEAALDGFVTKIVMQPYGYYAAKFNTYAFQHTTERSVVDAAKKEVYGQIEEICAKKR